LLEKYGYICLSFSRRFVLTVNRKAFHEHNLHEQIVYFARKFLTETFADRLNFTNGQGWKKSEFLK